MVPIIGPETKGWNLLSRSADLGSKTGTKGSCEPGQKAHSPLVVGNSMFPIYSNITKKSMRISMFVYRAMRRDNRMSSYEVQLYIIYVSFFVLSNHIIKSPVVH